MLVFLSKIKVSLAMGIYVKFLTFHKEYLNVSSNYFLKVLVTLTLEI